MDTAPYTEPFKKEHQDLTQFANGARHIRVVLEAIKDLIQNEDPMDIAWDIHAAEVKVAKTSPYSKLYKVDEPKLDGEVWMVGRYLTPLGQSMYDALSAGILWHKSGGYADYGATLSYYREMIAKGTIEMRFVDLLIENKRDELADLRRELVYFKMRGQRDGEVIRGAVEDA